MGVASPSHSHFADEVGTEQGRCLLPVTQLVVTDSLNPEPVLWKCGRRVETGSRRAEL